MSSPGAKTGGDGPLWQGLSEDESADHLRSAARIAHNGRIAELFKAHNQQLLRFLRYRLGSAHEAKEVAQEAYVRMLQLDAPDSIGYLRAFLFKTAANLATDRLRSSTRRGRIDQLEFFEPPEHEPSPEGGVSAQQEVQEILRILEELPARCRYAFVLHQFRGDSVSDIASSLDVSVRTVQLYLERALTFCRERLQEASGRGSRE